MIVPVEITIFKDKDVHVHLKSPPAAVLLKYDEAQICQGQRACPTRRRGAKSHEKSHRCADQRAEAEGLERVRHGPCRTDHCARTAMVDGH